MLTSLIDGNAPIIKIKAKATSTLIHEISYSNEKGAKKISKLRNCFVLHKNPVSMQLI